MGDYWKDLPIKDDLDRAVQICMLHSTQSPADMFKTVFLPAFDACEGIHKAWIKRENAKFHAAEKPLIDFVNDVAKALAEGKIK